MGEDLRFAFRACLQKFKVGGPKELLYDWGPMTASLSLFSSLPFFGTGFPYSPSYPGTHYVKQADLALTEIC